MKKLFTFLAFSLAVFCLRAQALQTFHDFSAISFTGDTISMSQFQGKKVMVVNVASLCSYTPQYEPLQGLYDSFQQQYNFEIIGFLSDDFFQQAGTDTQIVHTCQNYGITFLIMDRIHVASGSIHPIYQWLEQINLNGVSNATVTWNFNKFLIDEAGHWVAHYGEGTDPKTPAIVNWIKSASVISSAPSLNPDDMIEFKSSNPTGSSIDFVLKNIEEQHYTIRMYSSQGQLIGNIFDGVASASQNISYPVSSLASGIYLISVQGKDVQKTFRYSVVR